MKFSLEKHTKVHFFNSKHQAVKQGTCYDNLSNVIKIQQYVVECTMRRQVINVIIILKAIVKLYLPFSKLPCSLVLIKKVGMKQVPKLLVVPFQMFIIKRLP